MPARGTRRHQTSCRLQKVLNSRSEAVIDALMGHLTTKVQLQPTQTERAKRAHNSSAVNCNLLLAGPGITLARVPSGFALVTQGFSRTSLCA